MEKYSKPKVVVIGSLNMDLVTKASRFPDQGETILGDEFTFSHGGKGANQAVSLSRLGARTTLVGALGADSFGDQLLDSLKKSNVDTSAIKIVDKVSTGIASILLTEDDNSIIVVSGANNCCLPQDIDKHEDIIKQADIILLQMEIPLETISYSIKLAKKYDKKVVLNPAPAKRMSKDMLELIDYITPNATELATLTDIRIENQDDLEKAMAFLIDKGVKNVITTLGSEGVAFMTEERNLKKVKAYNVPVVSTIGAGDAFNAGLAYSIGSDNSLEKAISFANIVAALAVTKPGAQNGMPYLKEVLEFST